MGKRGKTPNPLAPYACVAVHLVILVIIKALVLRSASKEFKRFVESLPEKVSAEGARQPSQLLRRTLGEQRVHRRDPEDAKGIVDAHDCAAHERENSTAQAREYLSQAQLVVSKRGKINLQT